MNKKNPSCFILHQWPEKNICYRPALFSIFSFCCGLASSGVLLILFRSLAGLGSAMIFGTNMAILTSVFQVHERGKAIGINTSVVYFALASGPFFGGMVTHYWGWRSPYWVLPD
jgi:MFS family permease